MSPPFASGFFNFFFLPKIYNRAIVVVKATIGLRRMLVKKNLLKNGGVMKVDAHRVRTRIHGQRVPSA